MTATHELDIVPLIGERVVVLGEDRRVLAHGAPEEVLADRDLLIRALVRRLLGRREPSRAIYC